MSRILELKAKLDQVVDDLSAIRSRIAEVADGFRLGQPKDPDMAEFVEAAASAAIDRQLSLDRMELAARKLAADAIDVSTDPAAIRAVAELFVLDRLKNLDVDQESHDRSVAKWDEFRSLLWSAVRQHVDGKATKFVVAWVPKDGRVWPAVFAVTPDGSQLPPVVPISTGTVIWSVPERGEWPRGWRLY